MKRLVVALRLLGIGFLLHALMLVGADEITSFENGYIRTIRSLDQILKLYGADPEPAVMALPAWLSPAFAWVLSLPGWGAFAVIGVVLAAIFRVRD
jgi:hypothetical protein